MRSLSVLVPLVAAATACGLDTFGIGRAIDDGVAPDGQDGGDAHAPSSGDATSADSRDEAPPHVDANVNAGRALRFDGNGDYVEVGALAMPASFTLEAWMRPETFGDETYVIAKDRVGQGAGQLRLGLFDGGRLFFIMSDAAGVDHGLWDGSYVLSSASALPANVWSHVAVTKNGAAFALYVGGAAVDTFTASASFVHGGPAVPFRIGARAATDGGTSGGFHGAIDEVRLWNLARSGAEIAASMTAPPPAGTAGLVASYRFDEGSGTTTAEAKGGLAGSLRGNPTWITSGAF